MQERNKIPLDAILSDDSGEGEKASETQKNLGGRPSQIDDETLCNRRDWLIQLLSDAWGDIGWGLACSRTVEQLRVAFSSLPDPVHEQYGRYIQPFLRSKTILASASDIRTTRKVLDDIVRRSRELLKTDANPSLDSSANQLRQSGHAIVTACTENLEILLDEHLHRLTIFRKLKAKADRVEEEWRELGTRLGEQEAFYAQSELLKFISSGKYAHNPRNIAQAMAGLPENGCWQSFQRCEKQPSALWPMQPHEVPVLSYQVFKIIEECFSQKDCEPDRKLLDLLRERIRTIPDDRKYLRFHLQDNWRYLRRCIEQTDLAKTAFGAVPYRILGAFIREMGKPRSAEEGVLAARERRSFELL